MCCLCKQLCWQYLKLTSFTSINQSNQSINQSVSQSVSQSVKQAISYIVDFDDEQCTEKLFLFHLVEQQSICFVHLQKVALFPSTFTAVSSNLANSTMLKVSSLLKVFKTCWEFSFFIISSSIFTALYVFLNYTCNVLAHCVFCHEQ